MLYLLSLFGLLTLNVNAADDHGHDHDGEAPDCECATGITLENCNNADHDLPILQEYIVDHDCSQYCTAQEYTGGADGFVCLQAWFLIGQYHDFCVSGTVNETLFHEYLDVCPDCAQEHFEYEGAADCDESLDCEDADAQLTAINYVLNNCIDDAECTDTCKTSFTEAEGYHRICDHDDISEQFDTAFDTDPWSNTLCPTENIHCNVPEEANHTLDCSAELNEEFTALLAASEPLDVEELDHGHGDAAFSYGVLSTIIVSTVMYIFA